MADGIIIVPPDSTGAQLRMRSQTIAAEVVQEQAIYEPGLPTYRAFVDANVPAANEHHIALFNQAGSNQSVYVLGLYYVNLSIAGVTGVLKRYDIKRVTASMSGGTDLTALLFDARNPALANVQLKQAPTTPTEGAILKPLIIMSEEHTAAVGNMLLLLSEMNLMPPYKGGQPWTFRPGEGFSVKQITSSTVGSFAWILDFAVEAD